MASFAPREERAVRRVTGAFGGRCEFPDQEQDERWKWRLLRQRSRGSRELGGFWGR